MAIVVSVFISKVDDWLPLATSSWETKQFELFIEMSQREIGFWVAKFLELFIQLWIHNKATATYGSFFA